ncbi:MAG: hypothetical protein LIO96_06595 [Lachnospiraceae bacterium]|nr:hypothetical protein [Lachnospiraceae bacterium]
MSKEGDSMGFPEYTADCPQGVFETIITVTDEMTDEYGMMRIGNLARVMETMTESHLSAYGLSREELQEEGKIWVIAWTSVEIEEIPKKGMKVLCRIWPGKNKAMMYTRRYAFYTPDGKPLACASSLFILMDQQRRTAAASSPKIGAIPIVALDGEPALPKMRVSFPEADYIHRERIVRPEEIDRNGHLNNTHYLDWAESLPGDSVFRLRIPKKVWVQYSRELKEGQRVDLQYACAENTLYLRGISDGAEAFALTMEFPPVSPFV